MENMTKWYQLSFLMNIQWECLLILSPLIVIILEDSHIQKQILRLGIICILMGMIMTQIGILHIVHFITANKSNQFSNGPCMIQD